ncbi:cysteine--tRNA ligase [Gryllotalpicola ginsengisoli]|uniref:cysteine--tRNA ligase n=1 Tax=Gryllotalpicola ginsengisoli TaxID=444608 RepID=UPI0003B6E2B6|nr:cysteine--tRNA ligase [Gryllotalpicola ginsengisoli]
MTIRLYDTKAQALRDFVPLVDGAVGLYVCGPTVQSSPHIGHVRSALVYDIMRRWFDHRGLTVTMVRNVTDIDDKVLANAAEAQQAGSREQWWALAYRVELEFAAAYRALGILPPSYEPRATASIPQMHALIERLISAGHAYPAADGSGDVYFDVRSYAPYGALSRQSIDDMQDAADADPRGKRDPRDFALWKGRKEGEPESATWDSPWGPGRPGWHIECSAMSSRYLGPEFDIHGGGVDLRFPHHENELAQSTAAGDGFARYWVHNGAVNINGQKMSKSLGNSVFVGELLASVSPLVLRYALGQAHYRSTIDYTDRSLAEAEAAVERIEGFLVRSGRRLEGTRFRSAEELVIPEEFAEAMDDDLSVPQALAVLHDTVREGNTALDAEDLHGVAVARGRVRAMTRVLGIDPLAPEWRHPQDVELQGALEALITRMLDDRQAARAAKDFAVADRIRDELVAAGITIEDTPTGAQWSINGD